MPVNGDLLQSPTGLGFPTPAWLCHGRRYGAPCTGVNGASMGGPMRLGIVILVVGLAGCGTASSGARDGGDTRDAGSPCDQGAVQDCDCYNGIGRSTCDQTRQWGPCDCRSGVVRPYPDAGPLPDAGSPDAGNQGCVDACETDRVNCNNDCSSSCTSTVCNSNQCAGSCNTSGCQDQISNCVSGCENQCAVTAQDCESHC